MLNAFEKFPIGPFSTVTEKLPAANIAVPLNCVELALDSALLGMLHVVNCGAHPGPLKKIVAPFGSKPVPLMVKLNACPATAGLGNVVIPLS